MSALNGHEPDGPAPIVGGHLVVYDGVVAFRPDGSDEVMRREFPVFMTGLLAQVLNGEEPDPGQVPGMFGMLKGLRRG